MRPRNQLQTLLEKLLGSRNVYYAPPENLKMSYPCIVYSLDGVDTRYAENIKYLKVKKYQVQLIQPTPSDAVMLEILDLPNCTLTQSPFVIDRLHHYTFSLYY